MSHFTENSLGENGRFSQQPVSSLRSTLNEDDDLNTAASESLWIQPSAGTSADLHIYLPSPPPSPQRTRKGQNTVSTTGTRPRSSKARSTKTNYTPAKSSPSATSPVSFRSSTFSFTHEGVEQIQYPSSSTLSPMPPAKCHSPMTSSITERETSSAASHLPVPFHTPCITAPVYQTALNQVYASQETADMPGPSAAGPARAALSPALPAPAHVHSHVAAHGPSPYGNGDTHREVSAPIQSSYLRWDSAIQGMGNHIMHTQQVWADAYANQVSSAVSWSHSLPDWEDAVMASFEHTAARGGKAIGPLSMSFQHLALPEKEWGSDTMAQQHFDCEPAAAAAVLQMVGDNVWAELPAQAVPVIPQDITFGEENVPAEIEINVQATSVAQVAPVVEENAQAGSHAHSPSMPLAVKWERALIVERNRRLEEEAPAFLEEASTSSCATFSVVSTPSSPGPRDSLRSPATYPARHPVAKITSTPTQRKSTTAKYTKVRRNVIKPSLMSKQASPSPDSEAILTVVADSESLVHNQSATHVENLPIDALSRDILPAPSEPLQVLAVLAEAQTMDDPGAAHQSNAAPPLSPPTRSQRIAKVKRGRRTEAGRAGVPRLIISLIGTPDHSLAPCTESRQTPPRQRLHPYAHGIELRNVRVCNLYEHYEKVEDDVWPFVKISMTPKGLPPFGAVRVDTPEPLSTPTDTPYNTAPSSPVLEDVNLLAEETQTGTPYHTAPSSPVLEDINLPEEDTIAGEELFSSLFSSMADEMQSFDHLLFEVWEPSFSSLIAIVG